MVYYTAVAMLCGAALLVFCLMLGENGRLSRKAQLRVYASCGVMFLSFASEWSALMLNGAPAWTTGLHIFSKCLDYSLTPALGICVSYIVLDEERLRKGMLAILCTNAFIEIISAFTGHIYYVDEENFYHHGPAHIIYVVVFLIAMAYVIYTFVVYSRMFRKANLISLVMIMLLTAMGIVIQEIIGGYVRTACISLTFGIILIFIHYTQYGLMEVDEHVNRQQEMLDTDALSGCLSRRAYEETVGDMEGQALPAGLVIVSVDINDLKTTNDSLGHSAGDELITLSASSLMKVFGDYGKVYRTGGDEFAAFLYPADAKISELIAKLREETAACRGKQVKEVCLSCGYAAADEHPELPLKELIAAAERMMYEDKAAFYRLTGRNRRSDSRDGSLNPGQLERLLQNIMLEQYYKIMYVNLSADVFTAVSVDKDEWKLFSEAEGTRKLSAVFAAFADSPLCYEADRKRFSDFTDLKALRHLLTVNHFRPVRLRYRRKFRPDDTDFSEVELRVIPVNSDPDNLMALTFVHNLTAEGEARERDRSTVLAACVPDNSGLRRILLVIEDNPMSLELLTALLENEYDIVSAGNVRDGLEILSHRYDEISAILLDIEMTASDCYEFLQIRQGELLLRRIPVIVTMGSGTAEEERCLELGASDFVRKPCAPNILLHRLRSMISLRETANGLSAMETDNLTGLYSRQAFFLYAQNLLDRNPNARFDLVISDIQDFKHINDQYGREKADEFLRFWGGRLKSDNIEQRIAGRFGSDQFVLLVRNDIGFRSADVFSGDTFAMFAKGSPISDAVIQFGIYENVDHALSIAEMCDRALIALSAIKGHYDQITACFTADMLERLNRERVLIDNMESSLAGNDFSVYYQAIHDAKTGELVGAEALTRWNHPNLGSISPGEFIPLFERNGFVTRLDLFVWEQVCSDLRAWLDAGAEVVPISVNASRRDLTVADFREKVLATASRYGIPYDLLRMEVTESLRSEGLENSIALLEAFRADGISVELDDFGAGYSTLNLLNRMPMDIIKLDISFVRSLKTQEPVIRSIIRLGHDLGCSIISEGVENEEQLSALREMGCDFIQGYYFSKPIPREEFTGYMKRFLKK